MCGLLALCASQMHPAQGRLRLPELSEKTYFFRPGYCFLQAYNRLIAFAPRLGQDNLRTEIGNATSPA